MSLPNPYDFPVVLTDAGAQPATPAEILAQLTAVVAAQVPGYTNSLPGSLIEDISSTDVAAIALCEQARVELLNSMTPFAANVFMLEQLGQVYGVPLGSPTNTSVYVQFTGTVGYIVNQGVIVTDGTNSFALSTSAIIGNSGTSPLVNVISTAAGIFGVPANTVTTVVTTIPATITLTVTNPNPGTPGTDQETFFAYRARVLQAGLAASVGTARYIKTLIGQVLGAQSNLISVQQAAGGLRICVGGAADSYSIANAIFQSIADPSTLQGSAVSGTRNVTVSVNDYPDTYDILYVAAPVQTVTMTVTWNTVLTSFTGGAAFPSLVVGPIAAYINSLAVGQVINVLEMNELFQAAVEDVLDASLLTRLVFAVSLNGTPTSPGAGTYAITGDPESSFSCLTTGITVVQG